MARSGWSGVRAPIAWAIAGATAGAIAIAVFALIPTPRGIETEQKLAESKQQLEAERKRLEEERKRDEEKRRHDELVRKRFEEQQKQEEAKRLREEQARLEEQRKLDEARKRLEEQQLKLARSSKPPTTPATKPTPQPVIATRPPPPVIPVEPEPSEAPPVVALAKPRPTPQAEQLARGEGALARRDYAGALELLTPLAKDGNTRAQVRLAEMYASGQGVRQNTIQSYIWYSLAARGGNTSAAAGRDRMAARLQPAEIAQADKVVDSMRGR